MLQLTVKNLLCYNNVGSPTALKDKGGYPMDSNSLSHTKWNCKYHIVFAPKYRRKVAYGKMKQDIANILSMLCKRKKCRNSRGRDMPRPCAYACKDTTKFKCFKFCRVFERKKYTYDLRTPCKFKIQIWKSPFLVQRILRRYCRENCKEDTRI